MNRKRNKSIPTEYKGITFRSRLEARIAFWLDSLNVVWEYEPKSFILKKGKMIWPDFHLPELKTWLEVKGWLEPHTLTDAKNFAKEYGTEMLIITPDNSFWFSRDGGESAYCGKCPECDRHFFCGNVGTYHCRHCGFYDGMSPIRKGISSIVEGIKSLKPKMLGGDYYDA